MCPTKAQPGISEPLECHTIVSGKNSRILPRHTNFSNYFFGIIERGTISSNYFFGTIEHGTISSNYFFEIIERRTIISNYFFGTVECHTGDRFFPSCASASLTKAQLGFFYRKERKVIRKGRKIGWIDDHSLRLCVKLCALCG